jgi:hypothetical protein
MADSDITAAIHSKLVGYVLSGSSAPYFSKVFKGPNEGLAPLPKMAAWEYNRSETPPHGAKTFGNTMRVDVFRVLCFWPRLPLDGARETFEDDVYVVSHDLPGEFWADATLGGYCTDLDIPESSKRTSFDRYPDIDGPFWRTFTFEVHITVLEGEAISG